MVQSRPPEDSQSSTPQDAGDWVSRTLTALRRQGGRATRQRREILHAIAAAPQGVSAEDLVIRIRRAGVRAARSTVYRTLDALREIGAVDIVHPAPEHHRYLARRSAHQHHMVCETCGQVAVLDGCEFQGMVSAIQRRTGYAITRHTLEIFGRCATCRDGAAQAGQVGRLTD